MVMKAIKVEEIVRRGTYSRIANQLAKRTDFEYKVMITVSQNAPCKNPKSEGWVVCNCDIDDIRLLGNPYTLSHVWVKTATLARRRKIWITNAF